MEYRRMHRGYSVGINAGCQGSKPWIYFNIDEFNTIALVEEVFDKDSVFGLLAVL